MINIPKPHVSLQPINAFLETDLASQLETLDSLDLLCRVQTLWASTGAVHNCMAPVELELIIDGIKPLFCVLVTAVSYPSMSMEQGCWAKISFRVPPIARARGTATSTENTLIHPVKLLPILLTLRVLFPRHWWWRLSLQPRLNTLILVVEIRHINHQILNHKHMRQRRDHRRCTGRDLRETSEAITPVDVHRA